MTEKLKRCPLCDGEAKLDTEIYYVANYGWEVKCSNKSCGCTTGVNYTKDSAVYNWNSRRVEKEPSGKLEKTEAENKKLREALTTIYNIVNDSKENIRPISVYEGAQIYAECRNALGLDE